MEVRKVASTDQLATLTAKARKAEYRQYLDDHVLDALDPEGVHVCSVSFPHGADDGHIRTVWLVKVTDKQEPGNVALDMSWEDYNQLSNTRDVLGENHP